MSFLLCLSSLYHNFSYNIKLDIFPLIAKAFIELICFKDHAQDVFTFFVIVEAKVVTVACFFAIVDVINGCAIFGVDEFDVFDITFSSTLAV